jgi:hypothetical protein
LGLDWYSTMRMEMVDNVVAYTTVADLISLYRSVSGCGYSRRQYYAQTHDVGERALRPLPYPVRRVGLSPMTSRTFWVATP